VRDWSTARAIYCSHIWRLLLPSKPARRYENLDPNQPAEMTAVSDGLVDLVIDEGRRTQDASAAELESIRTKVQFAFSTNLLLIGLLATELPRLHHRSHWIWASFLVAAALALFALGGALAVTVNQVRVPIIHPARASRYEEGTGGSPRQRLARDYALNAIDWSNINATERLVLRESSLYLTLAALIDVGVWITLHR
jgi:hypothetical protein